MKILVVGPSWVGDMVMAQSLFRELVRRHPQAIIDVIAPDWSRPLLERMPQVNKALVLPLGHGQLELRTRYRLGKELRDAAYDWAILLPNSLKSALLPFWAKIPRRTGWKGEMRYGLLNDLRHLDEQAYPLMVQRFVALADDNGSLPADILNPALQIDSASAQAAMHKFNLTTSQPVLALCPGAEFGPSKQWPAEHYRAVAKQKIREGWQVWLFGSSNDVDAAEAIAQGDQGFHILAGVTTLAEAVDLLSLASAVVSNDSGLMHIAAAVGAPLVAVYGSTSPDFTPPLTKQARVVQLGLDCSPCFERECPLEHLNCLKQLPPARVLSAISDLTSGSSGAA